MTQANKGKQTVDSTMVDSFFEELGEKQTIVHSQQAILRRPKFQLRENRKPLVLHIDDDRDLLNALSSRLTSSGFLSESALDGESGLESALSNRVDCIVLDYDMPGMRGDDVIRKLKQLKRTRDIPIVLLTAIRDESFRHQMFSLGADVFMTKPFEYKELRQQIIALIEPDDGLRSAVLAN